MRGVSVAVLVLCLALAATADEVLLTSGGSIRGRVLSEDDEEVVVQTDAGQVKLPRAKVRQVIRSQGGPARPPATPPTPPAATEAAAPGDPEAAARGTLLLFGHADCDATLVEEIAAGLRRSVRLRVEVLPARPRADESEPVENRASVVRELAGIVNEPDKGDLDDLERRVRAKLARDARPIARQAEATLDDQIRPRLNARVLATQAKMVAGERLADPDVLAVLGVTQRDTSIPGMNIVFGRVFPADKAGNMSCYRFQDPSREQLVRRSVSEAVFLVLRLFDVQRCPIPSCAGAPTNGTAQHDQKGTALCPQCKAGLDAALARRRR